jgi:phospholipid-transporting ATPase
LNLFHQMTKPANIFFLVICFLQCIKPISITFGKPTNLPPLLFVIAVSMFWNFVEDLTRQRSDTTENNSLAHLEAGGPDVKWGCLGLGNIIVVRENEQFPADVVIIEASDGNLAFVETKNLDGETNLKSKITARFENGENLPTKLIGWQMQAEPPSEKIYQFNGVLSCGNQDIALTYENFCLRGSVLRNTGYVVGVVTYTGKDTKIMQNSIIGT